MTRHETEDKRIVITQFFCFLIALLVSYIFPESKTTPNFKVADALVMTGTVLLAIKLTIAEKFTLQYLLQKLENFHLELYEKKTIHSKADLKILAEEITPAK